MRKDLIKFKEGELALIKVGSKGVLRTKIDMTNEIPTEIALKDVHWRGNRCPPFQKETIQH